VINAPAFLALQQPNGGTGGLPILLFQVVAIGLVFWFLIIRPQATARKKHAGLLSQLKKGDEVMTAGGIVGVVRDIREFKERNETRVTIETGTSQVIVERSRIVRIGSESAPGPTTPA
jgi:preprotein translocase subunit YajC